MILTSELISALDYIENGSFEEALKAADIAIKENDQNFWAWYLGAIALGFLKDDNSFAYYLRHCEKTLPTSPYLKFLKAYWLLKNDRDEEAVTEWVEVLEEAHGWFARKLIDLLKRDSHLKEAALRGDIGQFVLLPDRNQESYNQEHINDAIIKEEKILLKKFYHKIFVIFQIVILLCLMFGFGFGIFYLLKEYIIQKPLSEVAGEWNKLNVIPNLQSAAAQDSESSLYKYTDKQYIIDDFEKAKYALNQKKVNTARYLLQRIISSNADFVSKEKCKIFIGFIPELDKDEITDYISIDKILKEPEFHFGVQILQDVFVLSERDTNDSKQLQAIVKTIDNEYLIEAFLKLEDKNKSWKPYSEFVKKEETSSTDMKPAVLFGQFKGLVGPQRKIYIEVHKLWY